MYTCICVYVYINMYICIYVYMYMCKCICICKYVYMCIYVYMYVCMCVSMHIYLFTHIILRYPDSWVSSQYDMRFQAAPHPHRHLSRSCARGAALGHQRRRPAQRPTNAWGMGICLRF